MPRGSNLPAIGGFNQAVVLDLIRRSQGGVSRVEIASATGLSPQTVTNVTRRLMADDLVRAGDRQIVGPGKPRTALHLVPRGRLALGVHLDPSFLTYVVIDLNGAVIAREVMPNPPVVAPRAVIEAMTGTIETLIADAGIDRKRLLGVGLAAPGPIDRDRGVVDRPPLLEGWNDIALRDALGGTLDMPVALEKDVTAAAVGELWTDRAAGRDAFAVFYYGTGLGLGVVLDHTVQRGATANFGDIGHLLVSDGGPTCRCGRCGCLGENVSPASLVAEAVRGGVLDRPTTDPDATLKAFERIAEAAGAGDAAARELLGNAASDIASAVVILANLLDIRDVVFSGPFWEPIGAAVLDSVRAEVDGSAAYIAPHPLTLSHSVLGVDATAIGAGCEVLDATFSPHPSAMLIGAGRG